MYSTISVSIRGYKFSIFKSSSDKFIRKTVSLGGAATNEFFGLYLFVVSSPMNLSSKNVFSTSPNSSNSSKNTIS